MSELATGRLAGRNALVTGAGGGIGRAIARRLAAEGATVLLTDRDSTKLEASVSLLREAGCPAAGLIADVTDAGMVGELFAKVNADLSRLDILVNCAGVVMEEDVQRLSLADWRSVLDANLTSVFLTCQQVIGPMTEQGYGRIINVASQLALTGAAQHSAYAAAKAGVIAFTKSLAREVSAHGVTANCVAPGPVNTAMLKRGDTGWHPQRVDGLPIGRVGEPDEVAGSVVLLADEVDGALYTGQVLGPNCGDVM